jgi:hypothetical protein
MIAFWTGKTIQPSAEYIDLLLALAGAGELDSTVASVHVLLLMVKHKELYFTSLV